MSQTELAKNTLFFTAASIGQKALAFLYFSFVARVIGVENLGAYAFALAVVVTIGVIDDLGLTSVIIREIAKTPEKAKTLVRTVIGVKCFTMPLTIAIALAVPRWLGYDAQIIELVQIAIAIMLADTLSLTFFGVLRGMRVLQYESIGYVVGQLLTTLVGGGLLLTGRVDLPLLIAALIAGSVWNALFSAYHVVRRLGWGVLVPQLALSPALLRMSFAFFLSAVFVKIYSYVDSFMLKHLIGDTAVGLYSVAYKLTYAFQFLPMAFVGALYPTLSARAERPEELRRIVLDAQWYVALLAAPIVFGIFALAPEIIHFFYGPDYAAAATPLAVLIFALLFIFLDFPLGSLLNATGRQSTKTVIMGATMVVNIVANVLLIPRLGIVGASASAVISFIFMYSAGWVVTRRILSVNERDLLQKIGGVMLAGAVMTVAVLAAKQVMPWLLTVPLGAAVFFTVAYLTKAFTLAHVRQFRALVRPRKYASSTSADN